MARDSSLESGSMARRGRACEKPLANGGLPMSASRNSSRVPKPALTQEEMLKGRDSRKGQLEQRSRTSTKAKMTRVHFKQENDVNASKLSPQSTLHTPPRLRKDAELENQTALSPISVNALAGEHGAGATTSLLSGKTRQLPNPSMTSHSDSPLPTYSNGTVIKDSEDQTERIPDCKECQFCIREEVGGTVVWSNAAFRADSSWDRDSTDSASTFRFSLGRISKSSSAGGNSIKNPYHPLEANSAHPFEAIGVEENPLPRRNPQPRIDSVSPSTRSLHEATNAITRNRWPTTSLSSTIVSTPRQSEGNKVADDAFNVTPEILSTKSPLSPAESTTGAIAGSSLATIGTSILEEDDSCLELESASSQWYTPVASTPQSLHGKASRDKEIRSCEGKLVDLATVKKTLISMPSFRVGPNMSGMDDLTPPSSRKLPNRKLAVHQSPTSQKTCEFERRRTPESAHTRQKVSSGPAHKCGQKHIMLQNLTCSGNVRPSNSKAHEEQAMCEATVEADLEADIQREIEEEIAKEILFLSQKLAELHAQQGSKRGVGYHDKAQFVHSCPQTPLRTEKFSEVAPETARDRDAKRRKGRVVAAKFLLSKSACGGKRVDAPDEGRPLHGRKRFISELSLATPLSQSQMPSRRLSIGSSAYLWIKGNEIGNGNANQEVCATHINSEKSECARRWNDPVKYISEEAAVVINSITEAMNVGGTALCELALPNQPQIQSSTHSLGRRMKEHIRSVSLGPHPIRKSPNPDLEKKFDWVKTLRSEAPCGLILAPNANESSGVPAATDLVNSGESKNGKCEISSTLRAGWHASARLERSQSSRTSHPTPSPLDHSIVSEDEPTYVAETFQMVDTAVDSSLLNRQTCQGQVRIVPSRYGLSSVKATTDSVSNCGVGFSVESTKKKITWPPGSQKPLVKNSTPRNAIPGGYGSRKAKAVTDPKTLVEIVDPASKVENKEPCNSVTTSTIECNLLIPDETNTVSTRLDCELPRAVPMEDAECKVEYEAFLEEETEQQRSDLYRVAMEVSRAVSSSVGRVCLPEVVMSSSTRAPASHSTLAVKTSYFKCTDFLLNKRSSRAISPCTVPREDFCPEDNILSWASGLEAACMASSDTNCKKASDDAELRLDFGTSRLDGQLNEVDENKRASDDAELRPDFGTSRLDGQLNEVEENKNDDTELRPDFGTFRLDGQLNEVDENKESSVIMVTPEFKISGDQTDPDFGMNGFKSPISASPSVLSEIDTLEVERDGLPRISTGNPSELVLDCSPRDSGCIKRNSGLGREWEFFDDGKGQSIATTSISSNADRSSLLTLSSEGSSIEPSGLGREREFFEDGKTQSIELRTIPSIPNGTSLLMIGSSEHLSVDERMRTVDLQSFRCLVDEMDVPDTNCSPASCPSLRLPTILSCPTDGNV